VDVPGLRLKSARIFADMIVSRNVELFCGVGEQLALTFINLISTFIRMKCLKDFRQQEV